MCEKINHCDCDCDGWKESMPYVAAALYMSFSTGYIYLGQPFDHCPWCGKKLGIKDDL